MSEQLEKVVLNNGMSLDVVWSGAAQNILWISGLSMTIKQAVDIFTSKEHLSKIEPSSESPYIGYTELFFVSIEDDGLIKVGLRKEG